MDIRKFFTPSGSAALNRVSTNKKNSPSGNGNGLTKERQLDLSPSKKQTKSFQLDKKKPKRVAVFSSDDSDGESPISNEVRRTCKTANRIESDEEENFHSASTSNPVKKTTLTKSTTVVRRTSFRDDDSSRDSNNSSAAVKRRTARKVYDEMAPLNEVFTNKKRKDRQPAEEKAENPAVKRPKCDNEVPDNVANEMFTTKMAKGKKTAKMQAAAVKLPERPRNPKIDKSTSSPAKAPKPSKRERFEKSPSNEAKEVGEEPTLPKKSSTSPATKRAKAKEKQLPVKMAEMNTKCLPVKQPTNVTSQLPKPVNAISSQRSSSSQQLNNIAWVDKYKPKQLNQLVGQHTDKSPLNKLLDWLRDWPSQHLGKPLKKMAHTSYTSKNDGKPFKAVLVSGPPGIGKTTCAMMSCRELNLGVVETNASDTRNKKTIDLQVSSVIDSQQINGFFVFTNSNSSKVPGIDHVLIMDEVDGMSGNQDRAGIAELIQMIKRTKVPIICICNDRQSQKIRSLANYCFDLRFTRPRAEQIKGRLLTIVSQERVKVEKDTLDKIIEASNQDIRQCINTLQMVAAGSASSKFDKKDVAVNVFEAARKVLTRDTNIFEKQELFFSDYSIMPLFVHENYLNLLASHIGNTQRIRSICQAADCMAFGDVIEKQIRSTGAWNLLVEQAMFSCALPSVMMDGYLSTQIVFPAWFGKTSNEGKRRRFMRQLASHTQKKISGSTSALVTDYLPVMRERLYRSLIRQDASGVREVIDFYKAYDLVRDDMEAINDLSIWPNENKAQKDISQRVSAKIKAALTRALNKEPRMLPFAQEAPVKGRRKGAAVASLELDEEGHEVVVGGGAEDEDEEEAADE